MKKTILSILLVVILCFLCCGCDALDEMRQIQAVYLEDRSIMLADGEIYKMLPQCDELTPKFSYKSDSEIFVTEKDVPVLLSQIFGSYYYKSEDGMFISGYDNVTEVSGIYCREDAFERIKKQIKGSIAYNKLGYWYYDYTNKVETFYAVTNAKKDLIYDIITTQEKYSLYSTALNYDYKVDIYWCSDDEYFSRYVGTIYLDEGKFYIVRGNYYYNVPDEDSAAFAKIINKYVESAKKMKQPGY